MACVFFQVEQERLKGACTTDHHPHLGENFRAGAALPGRVALLLLVHARTLRWFLSIRALGRLSEGALRPAQKVFFFF